MPAAEPEDERSASAASRGRDHPGPGEPPSGGAPPVGVIGRVIAGSARNPMITILLVAGLGGLGLALAASRAARRDPRPVRRAGDRLHRVDGAQPRPRRGPDHLSDLVVAGRRARRQVRARPVDVRHVVRLRDLRGRHRHLLGAQPRARVPEPGAGAAAGRRDAALGPDATGVGWVFEYALVDRTGKHDLQQLRSLQDWNLRYALSSVKGVAEVASIGGVVKQYQVSVDPARSCSRSRSRSRDVVMAIQRSNDDVGGSVIEIAGHEHVMRGRGYVHTHGRPRGGAAARTTEAACRSGSRTSAQVDDRPGHPARRRRARRRRRGGRRHRDHALRRERARRDRRRQGAARRDPAHAADGRRRSRSPTTAPS